MPGDPKECREHARNCMQLAEASANAEITRTFVDLAHSWTRLALDLESAQALLVARRGARPRRSGLDCRKAPPDCSAIPPTSG